MNYSKKLIKLTSFTTFSFATAVLLAGCDPSKNTTARSSAADTNLDVSAKLDKAKQETKDALDSISDYAYAQRQEYSDKMRAQLDQTKQDLNELSTKVDQSSSSAKDEAKAKIHQMQDKLDAACKQLDGVKDATESNWLDFKAGTKKAFDDVKDSFNQARQWLSDKIAP